MSNKKCASASDILGGIKPVVRKTVAVPICIVCNGSIPAERMKALESLDTPSNRYTHTECSITTKIKGIYMGEVGTSKLQLCDKIFDDTVRTIFRKTENEDESSGSNQSEEET